MGADEDPFGVLLTSSVAKPCLYGMPEGGLSGFLAQTLWIYYPLVRVGRLALLTVGTQRKHYLEAIPFWVGYLIGIRSATP